uniref:Transcriptional regulatory protein TOD6 n=1 Tax=Talaromyces marneffei PM1 TaxID=1077442 RepID=A0A093XBI0_TALMA
MMDHRFTPGSAANQKNRAWKRRRLPAPSRDLFTAQFAGLKYPLLHFCTFPLLTMINLDAIIPYQPPLPPNPSKSSKPSKIAPLPSKPPPLIHPLPQKPDSSPPQSCQSMPKFISIAVDQEQTSPRPPSTNAFDRELAVWSDMAVKKTRSCEHDRKGYGRAAPDRNGSEGLADNSESRSSDIRSDSPGIPAEFQEPERPRSPQKESTRVIHGPQPYGTHDSAASDLQSENAIPVAVAHSDDVEVLLVNDGATNFQLAEALMHQPNVGVRSSGPESQDIPCEERGLSPKALPLNMTSSVSGETGLELQDQGDNQDSLHSCEGDHSTNEPASIQSQEPSTLVSSEQTDIYHHENCAVAVVTPAAQPPKPRKRPYRLRNKTQTYRTDPPDESDEFDDSDDDDDVDQAQHVEHQRHSKRPKYQPIVRSDPIKPEAVRDFKLGDFSLPDFRTVQRGVLTCEFFPSQIMYSFSWAEDRGCSDDRPPNEDNMLSKGYSRCEMNGIQGSDLHSSSKDVEDETTEKIDDNQQNSRLNNRKPSHGQKRRHKKPWTDEADARLKLLKEKDNLSWSQILKHFPHRTKGALQFRYSKFLKNSTSKSSVITSHGATDRNNTPPSSPHSDRQPQIDYLSQSATESTLRSRYGPARNRRSVKRYSPEGVS